MMFRPVDLWRALIVLTLLWATAAHAAEPARTHAAAAASAEEWSRILEDWTARAARGDRKAPAHLCALYFDGRGGAFDPEKTATWCRQAADLGDAGAMQQMGLLALAGVGTRKDPGEAATLCTAAHAHDPMVSAGFCLAAVVAEQRRIGQAVIPPDTAAPSVPDPTLAASIDHWTDLSNRGDHAAPAQMCDIYFNAQEGTFDSVKTADWCRRAAEFGNARAMNRLGLIHLWGVGLEKSSPQARALCTEAQARDPSVSASFCVAAVQQERTRSASDAAPAKVAYPAPWPAASDPALSSDALGADRALESMHTTPTGLHYNCRDLIRWSRYGLPLDSQVFDRPITQYRPQDYTALDQAAADCAVAIAPYDEDGSERRLLAEFHRRLPLLANRKQELAQATRERQGELSRQAKEDQDLSRLYMVMVAALSPAEQQCTDAIYRMWLSRGDNTRWANALEINSVSTSEVDGNTVVNGSARVIETPFDEHKSDNTYSCTFAGHSPSITARTLEPVSAPSLPVAAGK